MSSPFSLHHQSSGYPGRSDRNQEKTFNKGQAFGTIDSVGNYSDRTRVYIVQLKQGSTKSKVKAKALGIEESGTIERYKPGDRVLLAYPNHGRADQPIIVGRYNETTGYSLAENKVQSGVDRSNLPNNPEFNSRPDSLIISTPSSFEYINSDESGIAFSAPRVEDKKAKNDKSAGDSRQTESEIEGKGEENVKQANEALYISQRHILGSREYRYSRNSSLLETHRNLNNESAELSVVAAEADLDEADEQRRRQEETNKCLEERNKKVEEGLENLKQKATESGLAALNSFLPPAAQIGLERDEEGNIVGASLGPININTETGEVSVDDGFKYQAVNSGLSMLNESLPPYLQLCMGRGGILEVGDYGSFDIQSILQGEGDFDIGPFSMRDGEVKLNDSVHGLVNNAIDDLNQNLPEPLQVGFDNENGTFSIGPVDFDLNSGEIGLDKSSLSRTINRLSKQFLPPPLEISVSADFEAVSLGPVTYNSEDKSVSVLGETVFIDEGKCKKDKAQNQTPVSETPGEDKKKDSADSELIPTVPPLGQQTGGSGRFTPNCSNNDFLETYFGLSSGPNSRDPFRFDTFLKRFGENLLASGNYSVDRIGLEAGIFPHDGYDQLYGPVRAGAYTDNSFPSFDVDEDGLSDFENNGALDLAVILGSYGVELSGQKAQAIYDYFIEGSVFGLIDFTTASGNRHTKVVSYSIKADLSPPDTPEIVSYTLGCEGASDLQNEIDRARSSEEETRKIEESAPSTNEFLEFPLTLLQWAEEMDPQRSNVYRSLSQGAVLDAMVELIFQETGRNIDALGNEYERLRYAVARASHGAFRGHDIQDQISIGDLDRPQLSETSSFPEGQSGKVTEEALLLDIQIQDIPDHKELKDGDKIVLSGKVDPNVTALEILGVGALKPKDISVDSENFTIEAEVEAVGIEIPTLRSERIRVSSPREGQTFDLSDFGISPLLLNNTKPTLRDYSLNYPQNRTRLHVNDVSTLTLNAENYTSIEFESASLLVSQAGSDYEISIKDDPAQESEANLLIRFIRSDNGSVSEVNIPVPLDISELELTSLSNNRVRLGMERITVPIDMTFNKPVKNVELVGNLTAGVSQSFEKYGEGWRHYVDVGLQDIGQSKTINYLVQSSTEDNETKEHQIFIEITGFIPYRITLDTRQSLQFTVPIAIRNNFPNFQVQWLSESIAFSEVSEFSGDPFEYKNLGSGQMEISESFRSDYINGEAEIIISEGE